MTTTLTTELGLNNFEKIFEFISTIPTPTYSTVEDDKEFLEAILRDLDASWTVGYMCTLDGKRCLVGSGAYFSGAIYYPVRLVEDSLEKLPIDEYLSDHERAGNWVRRMDFANNDIEQLVGARLYDLLDFGNIDRDDDDDDLDYVPDKLEAVIEYNDNEGDFRDNLRPKIVAAIERLSV